MTVSNNRGTDPLSRRVYALIFNGITRASSAVVHEEDWIRLSERERIAEAVYAELAAGNIEFRLGGLALLAQVAEAPTDRPRPPLGPDDQGDCEACNHLVVSHQDDGCHAELRTLSGSRPCPCQLASWEVGGDTSPSPSGGGL